MTAICLKRDHMTPSDTDFIEVRWTLLSKINSSFEIEPFYRKRTLLSKMIPFFENESLYRKWTLLWKMYWVDVNCCDNVHWSYNLCHDRLLPRRVFLRSLQFWAFLLWKGAFFCSATKGNNAFDPLYSWRAFFSGSTKANNFDPSYSSTRFALVRPKATIWSFSPLKWVFALVQAELKPFQFDLIVMGLLIPNVS